MIPFPEIHSIARAIPNTISRLTQTRQLSSNPATAPVVSFPGIGSPEAFLTPLLQHLQDAGHNVRLGGNRINLGPTYRAYDRMEKLLEHAYEKTGVPIIGIGHSLGVLYHLHFAHKNPHMYQHIIGLAGPSELNLEEAHTHTNIGAAFYVMDRVKFLYRRDLMESWERESERSPLPDHIYCSMIIAAKDDIVSPYDCELPPGTNNRNFYVDTTHTGILTSKIVHELTEHLTRHGNQAPIPPHIKKHLLSRDDIVPFEKMSPPTVGDIVRGIHNFARTVIHR